MRFLPPDQKDQIKVFVGVVAAAAAALYYGYPHGDALAANEALAERIDRLEQANAIARREAQAGRTEVLRQEAARSRALLAVLRHLVPTEHEVPALLEQVSTAARRAGLEIGGVQPEPVLGGDVFDTYRYKVTLVGGYHQIATFLGNTGSLSRIVAPVTFQLLPVPSQQAAPVKGAFRPGRTAVPLQAQLTIQTYVMHASRSAPQTAGAAGSAAGTHTAATGGEVAP